MFVCYVVCVCACVDAWVELATVTLSYSQCYVQSCILENGCVATQGDPVSLICLCCLLYVCYLRRCFNCMQWLLHSYNYALLSD